MAPSDMDLMVVDLPEHAQTPGPRIQDLRLPPNSVITMVSRGAQVVSPNGSTRLHGGDQVTVLAHVQNEEAVKKALLSFFDPPSHG